MIRGQEDALRAGGKDIPSRQTKLLNVWKAIVDRRLPVVLHGPLDLLFLLRSFEQAPLPRGPELSRLIGRCFTLIYDLAHISRKHGETTYGVDSGRCMGLSDFLCLTRKRVPHMTVRDRASRQQLHDTGDDATATGKAFAKAQAWIPEVMKESGNVVLFYKHGDGLRLELPGAAEDVAADSSHEDGLRLKLPGAAAQNAADSSDDDGLRMELPCHAADVAADSSDEVKTAALDAAAIAEGPPVAETLDSLSQREDEPQAVSPPAAQGALSHRACLSCTTWQSSWVPLGNSSRSQYGMASHTSEGWRSCSAGNLFFPERGKIFLWGDAPASPSSYDIHTWSMWPNMLLHSDASSSCAGELPEDDDSAASYVVADSVSTCDSYGVTLDVCWDDLGMWDYLWMVLSESYGALTACWPPLTSAVRYL